MTRSEIEKIAEAMFGEYGVDVNEGPGFVRVEIQSSRSSPRDVEAFSRLLEMRRPAGVQYVIAVRQDG